MSRRGAAISRVKGLLEVLLMLLLDLLLLLMVFNISVHIRGDILPALYPGFPPMSTFEGAADSTVAWIFPVWIFFFYYEGLYGRRFSFWDEVRAEWKGAFFSTVAIFVIVSVGKYSSIVSRTVIVLMFLMTITVFPPIRLWAKKFLRKLGLFKRRVLVLGAGPTGELILKALRREPNYGYDVVGFLDDEPSRVGQIIDGVKVHRGISRAEDYINRSGITDVFITISGLENERLVSLINKLQHQVEGIVYVPDTLGMAVTGTTLQHFFHEQAIAIEVRNNLARPLNILTKRLFDFTVGGLLFILCLPVLLAVSALIRLDTPGPAIFTQKRVGKNRREFLCYKFRTMHTDSEKRLMEVLDFDPEAAKEYAEKKKLKDDPRVTRIGGFLRKTSLDELPQLINIVRGQMSLVGPRPYLPDEVQNTAIDISVCFHVLPGITGLWQVSGRSNTTFEYRNALDTWYVRNWNLWLDVVILLKTVRVVLAREGAY